MCRLEVYLGPPAATGPIMGVGGGKPPGVVGLFRLEKILALGARSDGRSASAVAGEVRMANFSSSAGPLDPLHD
jgi:hypothetical protein